MIRGEVSISVTDALTPGNEKVVAIDRDRWA